MELCQGRNGGGKQRARVRGRAGFSLVELLVVIFIIALIIGLVVPALASVRRSAKKTETQSLMSSLSSGVSAFTTDNRRTPGYFTQRDMGSVDNQTRGFSNMQNLLLDLAGGVEPAPTSGSPPPGALTDWGPRSNATQDLVIVAKIGAPGTNSKAYWVPNAKAFEVQGTAASSVDGIARRVGNNASNAAIPEIVDAFGAPILGWVVDDTSRQPIESVDDFAREAYATNAAARYYWNSNAAFLSNDVRVGRKGVLQNGPANPSILSQARTAEHRSRSLMGLLGNPGSPSNPTVTNLDDMIPTGTRGSVVLQSAGVDGVFLGSTDRGAGRVQQDPAGPILRYGDIIKGGPTILESFDDVISAAN